MAELTDEVRGTILEALRIGTDHATASYAAGVELVQFYAWKRAGDLGESKALTDFHREAREAEAAGAEYAKKIQQARSAVARYDEVCAIIAAKARRFVEAREARPAGEQMGMFR